MLREFLCAALNVVVPLGGLYHVIDQAPLFRSLSLNAFRYRAEYVRQVAADFALVGYASEAAGSRKHSQERNFGQADGRRAVVDENDFVAGERQFVSSTSGSAIAGNKKF